MPRAGFIPTNSHNPNDYTTQAGRGFYRQALDPLIILFSKSFKTLAVKFWSEPVLVGLVQVQVQVWVKVP